MKIFPAIDIKDKKCVRLVKGDFDNKTEYEMSPIDQAEKYNDHGFINLHIVDLDGALTGETVNLDIIQEIVKKFNLKIEVGGGVRNIDNIQKYIDSGVEKVILGSAAIKDKSVLKEACERFTNQIELGFEAKDGDLSVYGGQENSTKWNWDELKEVKDFRWNTIIILEETDKETIESIKNFNCKIVFQSGHGYGNALIDGIKNVETEYLCIFNADGSFKPTDLNKMLKI